jgi:subtilisin family serine protease
MRRLTIFVVLLSATTLAFIIMRTSAQNPQNAQIPSPDYPFPGYPEEFSPMKTWRPGKPPLTEPTSKFLKAVKPVPNRYIVKLKDEVVPRDNSIESKRDQISEIANSHAAAHRGQVKHIYAAVLRGFSIELPNEAAARAISHNPQVQWVSEVDVFKTTQGEGADGYNFDGDIQPNALEADPPWGLDAIDGTLPQTAPDINGQSTALNALYIYNATGAGVVAYVLDGGIFNQHQEFSTGSFSRASQLADCFTYVNCRNGQQTSYFNQQTCVSPMPNSNNNDCSGHGTQVAGIIGGRLTGVAKGVTIKSVKVCGRLNFCPLDSIIAGADLVTSDHLANYSTPAVANFSLGGPVSAAMDQAVSDTIQSGVTCVFSAGNDNTLALGQSPAHIPQGLTVGGVDWTGSREIHSNFGPPVDMYAPGARIVSAQSGNDICSLWGGTNHEFCVAPWGTSLAAPFVTGLVATYLQGRSGTDQCIFYPVQGPAPPCCGDPSICPDRVTRFIDATRN